MKYHEVSVNLDEVDEHWYIETLFWDGCKICEILYQQETLHLILARNAERITKKPRRLLSVKKLRFRAKKKK